MGLGGSAAFLVEITNKEDLKEAHIWAKSQNDMPVIMIGTGSNIVWRDEGFNGLVIVNKITGYSLYQMFENEYYLTIGAGENWDDVVAKSVADGLTGIESLSLIPGTAGATPVQNVGAYGQEISQTLSTIEAYDTTVNEFVTLPAAGCEFGYRTSRFKTSERGRFYITAITLSLVKANPSPPFYKSVTQYLETHEITSYTSETIRNAVIAIRTSKLPDPKLVHNVGSFFANPTVPNEMYQRIVDEYDMVPHWNVENGLIKLSAAWLIEQAGFKGKHDQNTGMATWENQPLVLVNENAKSTAALLAFKEMIVTEIKTKFGIVLDQEPELLPLP
jgi:UDP-N-acetylmuramate dehydrogenase